MTEIIALIGPDGTGKSSVCSEVNKEFDIEIIDVPNFTYSTSFVLRTLGSIFDKLADFGTEQGSRLFNAMFVYAPVVTLSTYADRRAKRISPEGYLFTRHPVYDIPVHLDIYIYIPQEHMLYDISRKTANVMAGGLSHPTKTIYLHATRDSILKRIREQDRQMQLHENAYDLDNIIGCYEHLIQQIPQENLTVIDTTTTSLENVCREVIDYIGVVLE